MKPIAGCVSLDAGADAPDPCSLTSRATRALLIIAATSKPTRAEQNLLSRAAASSEGQVFLAEVRHERGRNFHATIGLQIVFEDGGENARDGEA